MITLNVTVFMGILRLFPDQAKHRDLPVTFHFSTSPERHQCQSEAAPRICSTSCSSPSPSLISGRLHGDLPFMSPAHVDFCNSLSSGSSSSAHFSSQHHIQFCTDERLDLFKSGELTGSALWSLPDILSGHLSGAPQEDHTVRYRCSPRYQGAERRRRLRETAHLHRFPPRFLLNSLQSSSM